MKDLARIHIKAGDGGDGAVHFRREKYIPKGGPDGGDGGDGGSVYIVGDNDVETLVEFSYTRHFEAQDGERGVGQKKHGKSRDDLYVKVPVGTVVYEIPQGSFDSSIKEREGFLDIVEKRKELVEIIEDGQEYLIAEGGKGGLGNFHFRSSSNQTPREHEEGTKGDEKFLLLELKVIADVGIVGMPNVGKSSILKVMTRANPKIADYPFTTLEPNLGVFRVGTKDVRNTVLVDVPGVIEDAWEGKGIGPWFMRHLERVGLIVHVVAPDPDRGEEYVRQMVEDYKTVRAEMKKYGRGLVDKREVVVINKIEMWREEEKEEVRRAVEKEISREVLVASAGSGDVGEVEKYLESNLRK